MAERLPSAIECARLYLAPPSGAFWGWSNDGSAIEYGAHTLLLREELQAYLQHRLGAMVGMPPLHAIAFLMLLLRNSDSAPELAGVDLPVVEPLWQHASRVPQLRRALLDCALQTAPRTTPEFARNVGLALAAPLPEYVLVMREHAPANFAQIAEWLKQGLHDLTIERLEMLAATGLQDPPDPAALEPLPENPGLLLQELQRDDEFCSLASSARAAMAALRLPRRLQQHTEHAAGGVAGISNRGPLDRLLPSELAHDPDVLAIRIATHEALYVQSEPPSDEPRPHRRILLDIGVRMWGTPRVLGVAVAMALRALAAEQALVTIQTDIGASRQDVNLATRDGIRDQLVRQSRRLDCRGTLAEFLAGDETTSGTHHHEPIVVTSSDSANDPDFRRHFAPGQWDRAFVVALDEHGECCLWRVSPRGWEVCASACLPPPRLRAAATPQGTPQFYLSSPAPLPLGSPRRQAKEVTAIGAARGELHLLRRNKKIVSIGRATRSSTKVVLRATRQQAAHWLRLAPALRPGLALYAVEIGPEWIAYYDARGLLHFVPRDGTDPELSITITEGMEVEGWTSLGDCVRGEVLWQWLDRIVRSMP